MESQVVVFSFVFFMFMLGIGLINNQPTNLLYKFDVRDFMFNLF